MNDYDFAQLLESVKQAGVIKRGEFDDFSIHLSQDKEGDFIAYFVEFPRVSAYGESIEEALLELREAWEAMKESYRKHIAAGLEQLKAGKKVSSSESYLRISKKIKSLVGKKS